MSSKNIFFQNFLLWYGSKQGASAFWTGGYLSGYTSLSWIDKSPVDFTKWASGRPTGSYNYVVMKVSDGLWTDLPYNYYRSVMCQVKVLINIETQSVNWLVTINCPGMWSWAWELWELLHSGQSLQWMGWGLRHQQWLQGNIAVNILDLHAIYIKGWFDLRDWQLQENVLLDGLNLWLLCQRLQRKIWGWFLLHCCCSLWL